MRAPLDSGISQPCFSGRVAPGYTWTRCHRRVRVACQAGLRPQAPAVAKAAAPTRTEAYSGPEPVLAYGGATAGTSVSPATAAAPQQQDEEQQQLQQQGLLGDDPYKPSVSRPKPLKINLDLALYRARQVRINATRSKDLHSRSKMLREAENAMRRCLELDPTDGRPYVSLGKVLVMQRRYDEASKLYEEGAAATGGTNAHIWTAWANLAARQGNSQLARKLYDAAVVADAGHAAAWHGWGLMEKGLGNFTKARDLWVKGIQETTRRPNPYLYQSLAVLAAEMGVTEEARRWFQRGTSTVMGAASHALWQAWALMEQRQGDPHVVRTLFRRGLAISPRSRYTYLAWALWEKEQGNLEEARRLLREGSARNPRDAALLQAWALLEREQGNLELARRLFKRGSEADPSHLYIWQAWGVMEGQCGNLAEARELFQQGVWSAPPRDRDVSLIFQAWAVLESSAGNHSMARQLFKCAVKADPKSEPSWLAWAEMEDSLGAFDRANELRSFSLQERQEVVRPANFTTMPAASRSPLAQIGLQIAKWFHLNEDSESEEDLPDPLAALRSVDLLPSSGSEGEEGSGGAAAVAKQPATVVAAAAVGVRKG